MQAQAVKMADKTEAKLFLSYSRKDRDRAQLIADALRDRGFEVFRDTDDILPTEEWRGRLEQLIDEADTVVFLLSPNSATSEVCSWEVERAYRSNKRIAPIVIEDVDAGLIPPLLARLNFIFCTSHDPFENAVATLASALSSDIEWIREHTRMQGLARRWDDAGRPRRLLLTGQDVDNGETWRDRRPTEAPEITDLQAAYLRESRHHVSRRLRHLVFGSIAAVVITAGLAGIAYFQSVEANLQRQIAVANEQEAQAQRDLAQTNAEEAERQRRAATLRLIAETLRSGDFPRAAETALDLLPDYANLEMVLSGLETIDTIRARLPGNSPAFLNDQLHLVQRDGTLLPLDLQFPADTWLSFPGSDGVALVSDAGAVLRLDSSGQITGMSPSVPPFEPCFAYRRNSDLSLIGKTALGLSACSLALRELVVPGSPSSPITLQTYRACEDEMIRLDDANTLSVDDFFLNDGRQNWCPPTAFGDPLALADDQFGPGQEQLQEIPALQFPSVRSAEDQWSGPTISQINRTTAAAIDAAFSGQIAVPFGSVGEGEFPAPRFRQPDIMAFKEWALLRAITNWGGTGGTEHVLCTGRRGDRPNCTNLFTTSRLTGVVADPFGERALVIGDRLLVSSSDRPASQLWIVDSLGATPRGIADLEPFGVPLDAGFGPDGSIALLAASSLVILDPESGDRETSSPPPGAEALTWLADGSLLVLAPDRLFRGSPSDGFRAIPLTIDRGGDPEAGLWIGVHRDRQIAVLGGGTTTVAFDLTIEAPLMSPGSIDHPRLQQPRNTIKPQISQGPDGEILLTVTGATYATATPPPIAQAPAYLDAAQLVE